MSHLRLDSPQQIKSGIIQNFISSAMSRGKYFFLTSFLAISLLQSCKEPDEIGLDVLPDSDLLGFVFTDSVSVFSRTILEDSLRTDELTTQVLGSIYDPAFGKHSASVFTQALLAGTPSFSGITTADSLVLSLAYRGFYGDTTLSQTINVYRMTEDLFIDSAYYSNRTFSFDPQSIGSITAAPRPNTRVTVGSDTLTPRLRIRLSQTLADSLMLLDGSSTFASNDNWKAYFKGLHIAADPAGPGNTGSMSYFDFFNSSMILYYHDTSNAVKSYAFSLTGARMSSFSHDYSGSTAGQQLADSTFQDSLIFLQSMAGLRAKIDMPFLKHFTDSGSIVINRAELKITAQPGAPAEFPLPGQLLILAADSVGSFTFPLDYFESTGFFGGQLNTSDNSYTFNLGRHIQNILTGRYSNHGFYLVVSGSSVQSARAILGSGKNPSYRMKLNLYYTKVPR